LGGKKISGKKGRGKGTRVGTLGVNKLVYYMVWQWLFGLEVARHALQHFLLIAPILQHLECGPEK